jgi:hypothetical protein
MRTARGSATASCVPTLLLDGVRVPAAASDSTLTTLPLVRVFGIEIYSTDTELPAVLADMAETCGLIGVWRKRE